LDHVERGAVRVRESGAAGRTANPSADLVAVAPSRVGGAKVAKVAKAATAASVSPTLLDRPRLKRTIFAATRAAGVGPRRPAIDAFLAELRTVAVPRP
jgi:hypothetical protein